MNKNLTRIVLKTMLFISYTSIYGQTTKDKKKAIAFKMYTGISTRYKIYRYQNIDNIMEDGNIVPLHVEQGTEFWPVAIHLGVKIGLSNLVTISK